MTLLALDDVTKIYAGTPALERAHLHVTAGSVHALMGENGAGKSTLIKILAGLERPDSMSIRLEGEPVKLESPADAYALGFRFIHQELNVVPELGVAENIALGYPFPRRFGFALDWRRLHRLARQALDGLGVDHIRPETPMAQLSTGDQMLVRIAAALYGTSRAPARLYVMDEPTAALSGAEPEKLFAAIARLRDSGASVLYVSHRIEEVMRICDQVTVLRDGSHVMTGPIEQTSRDQIIAAMTGREVTNAWPPRTRPCGPEGFVQCTNLTSRELSGISFSMARGEIVGVTGLAGMGQGALLQALLGAAPLRNGSLVLNGRPRPIRNPARAWDSAIAYIPGERRLQGLMPRRDIAENISLPHLSRLGRLPGLVSRKRQEALAADLGRQVRLKSTGPCQPADQLSGGNQQKILFARAIGGNPELLLLDEPTRGVDVGARFDIYSLIRSMSDKGTCTLLASSDLPELLGMCDRIMILHRGTLVRIMEAQGLDAAGLLALIYQTAREGEKDARAS